MTKFDVVTHMGTGFLLGVSYTVFPRDGAPAALPNFWSSQVFMPIYVHVAMAVFFCFSSVYFWR